MKLLRDFFYYFLSLLYAAAVCVRNKCYDWRIFKSEKFRLPVIAVGNITVGGTGKTPHTEWLASLLQTTAVTAVLSRGYKRKTKGFRYVETTATVQQVGDEPLQIKRKNPALTVAVDANRVAGIRRLKEDVPQLGVVILDDAYQHRKVHPALSVLLVDYNRPLHTDHYLPYGRLRDNVSQKRRADVVIVTKCPANMQPIEQRIITKHLNLYPYQQLYFTRFDYGAAKAVFDGNAFPDVPPKQAAALTGIADPATFIDYVRGNYQLVQHLNFPDHHFFTPQDIAKINAISTTYPEAFFFTTEKDAQRLRMAEGLNEEVKKRLFYIPVTVSFLSSSDGTKFAAFLTKLVAGGKAACR
ncbi:MAG: tetraacyldisaccharide 4'-kinase [Prevotellaceae bacterium]|jgi:tetraacyldisaccharide 4'-kinase|nr:tetraacyldisaccharide 4'-kinase [Prevotellaceae bacterium]